MSVVFFCFFVPFEPVHNHALMTVAVMASDDIATRLCGACYCEDGIRAIIGSVSTYHVKLLWRQWHKVHCLNYVLSGFHNGKRGQQIAVHYINI